MCLNSGIRRLREHFRLVFANVLSVVLILPAIFQSHRLTRRRGICRGDATREGPSGLPDGGTPGSYIESTSEASNDVDSRPDLLRIDFADPDARLHNEAAEAQRAIRYVDFTLVPNASLIEGWNDLDSTEQRMYRAAVRVTTGNRDILTRPRRNCCTSSVTNTLGRRSKRLPTSRSPGRR